MFMFLIDIGMANHAGQFTNEFRTHLAYFARSKSDLLAEVHYSGRDLLLFQDFADKRK